MSVEDRLLRGAEIIETLYHVKGPEYLRAVVAISRLDMLVTDYNKAVSVLMSQNMEIEQAKLAFQKTAGSAYDLQKELTFMILKDFELPVRQNILKDAKVLRDSTDAKN